MTTLRIATAAPLFAFAAPRPAALVSRMAQARALARQRAQLADLPVERLADLGLTRDEALREAARPFWDAPRHWRG